MRLAVLVVVAIVTPALASAQSRPALVGRLACDDTAAAKLREGTFRLPVGRVRLSAGEGCVKALPELGCEWSVTLARADKWGDNAQYLAVVVETNHNTPGAWLSVLMYRCQGGLYQPVFAENYGPRGARMVLTGSSTFDVTIGEPLPDDPGCCPSRMRRSTYGWDDRRQVFTLTASTVTELPRELR